MPLDRPACYRALVSRDPRFDGIFYVGVTSTRIYCRPVCRVRTPREGNCRFFSHAAAAERAGFRPCLRCRPELAPGHSEMDATSVLAERATRAIMAGALNGASVDALAGSFGVTGRHLRRAVVAHVGASPIDLATTQRLLLAKRLLHETTLPVGQVAHAAGFESLRRFNSAFKGRYRLAPAALRREVEAAALPRRRAASAPAGRARRAGDGDGQGGAMPDASITLTLDYRAPLHWEALLAFLAARAAPGAEWVEGGHYAATVRLPRAAGDTTAGHLPGRTPAPEDVTGEVDVAMHGVPAGGVSSHASRRPRTAARVDAPDGGARHEGAQHEGAQHEGARRATAGTIVVRLSPSLVPVLMPLLVRLRDLLDLDANPHVIADHLVRAGVAASTAAVAGVRIPGTLDPFALAVRAILGQQVSVKGATTLMGRLVERFGTPYAGANSRLTRVLPTAPALAALATRDIASLGMPAIRADAVLALSRAVAGGAIDLAPGGDVVRTIRLLTTLPGIGDWTAHYIAMRALRWPDAFPANDLVLRRAAGNLTPAALLRRAEAWRPWRAYAAMHLWRMHALSTSTLVTR